jgi:hypothetical protein
LCKIFGKIEQMIRKLLYIPPKYAIMIQVAILIISFGVVAIVANTPKPEIKVYPQIQAVVHIESSPEFIAKNKKYKKNEQLTGEELRDILYSVGFRGERLKQAWAIVMKESTGKPRAHNDNPATGDNSYGLFQINMIGSLGPSRRDKFSLDSNKDLFNPVRNAEIAFFMSDGGKNWSAWNGMTNKTISWMSEFPSKP